MVALCGGPAAQVSSAGDCPVTRPNNQGYVKPHVITLRHGNEWLATSLSPLDGKVAFRPRGAGCVDGTGALWIKWPWWRKVSGELTIETTPLDGGQALKGRVLPYYGTTGFQPSSVGFPGPGCWQVTAHVGEGSLSFVTLVEKVGEGPPPCTK
jgi:hypothetical protein